jgi:hypothetical protein
MNLSNRPQLDYISDSGEEEDWWNDRNYIQSGVKVQVLLQSFYILYSTAEDHFQLRPGVKL